MEDSIDSTTSVDSPRDNISLHSTTTATRESNTLSTGLLTLSIHEALTFDGVELALHPDVFQMEKNKEESSNTNNNNNNPTTTTLPSATTNKNVGLKPGDLVVIRVWSLRPGVKVENHPPTGSSNTASNSSAIKSNMAGSNYHSRNPSLVTISSGMLSPGTQGGASGVKGTNYHSRNPSLVTLSSASLMSPGTIPVPVGRGGVYGGTTSSLVHTPQSSVAPGEPLVNGMNNTVLPPPLPSVIGGNNQRPSPVGGGGSFHYDSQDRETPELQGEYLIENSETETKAGTPGTSNLTSMASTSLVGSSLPLESLVSNPPLLTQKNKLSFSTIATDSVQGHSRDSSLATNPSTMHSRDNSLLTPNPSWLSASGAGGSTPSPRDESSIAQPALTSNLPSHPLATLSQQQSPHPSSSKKYNVALVQRPPLPPSSDLNVSLLSESGMDDSSKKQSLDLISEEATLDRARAATTGLEDEPQKRNSKLPTSGPTEDGPVEPNDAYEENSNVMDEIQKTHFVRVSFVVPISERSLTSIKSGARTQVSLLRRGKCYNCGQLDFLTKSLCCSLISYEYSAARLVADLYKVTAFCPVTITQVDKREDACVRKSNAADFITVTMKDQFVSR